MAGDTFERIEKKFWMTEEQFHRMLPVLRTYMVEDEYGYSSIRNIYCDTDDYYLIRRSIEKPKFKEKLRIRTYSDFAPDTKVFVEIKRKVLGIGYKRRIRIPFSQVGRLLSGELVECDHPQIAREMQEFVRRYHPAMKVYLTYDRVALKGKDDPGLRITIDQNIRYRMYEEGMDFSQEGMPVVDHASWFLMEVKAPGRLPDWLIASMSYHQIYQSSFSKIGSCFTRFVAPNISFRPSDQPKTEHAAGKEDSVPIIPVFRRMQVQA